MSTHQTRRYGLAPLSLLGTEPAQVVHTAAEAGFDFAGLRIIPVTDTEPDLNLLPGSARLQQVKNAVAQTGLPVVDVEFLALDGRLGRETWLPLLEAGAELNAASVTAAGCDPDRSRLTETVLELAGDCREHNLELSLEPISYQPLSTVRDAAALAAAADCHWLPDALHLNRSGADARDLAAHRQRVSMLQLCDGPLPGPTSRQTRVQESRVHRQAPGAGAFDLVSMVRAVPTEVLLSAEVPDPLRRAEIGDRRWAAQLLQALRVVAAGAR